MGSKGYRNLHLQTANYPSFRYKSEWGNLPGAERVGQSLTVLERLDKETPEVRSG